MQTITTIQDAHQQTHQWRQDNQRIVLVPTMGNLHSAHMQLVKTAKQHGDKVVVSIFVNPLQFGVNEDFANYPRTFTNDQTLLAQHDVDLLFAPHAQEMYPQEIDRHTFVEVPELSADLCGRSRPHHFRGVATVVSKLFNIINPDLAIFGEKDYQQLLIIKKMVSDLNLTTGILSITTQREADGLAISSRNQYLSAEERLLAPKLFQTLQALKVTIQQATSNDLAPLMVKAQEQLTAAGFNVDYLECRRRVDLEQPTASDQQLIILTAAYLGKTRLIDNLFVDR